MPGMIESEKLNALVQNIIKHKIATEFSMASKIGEAMLAEESRISEGDRYFKQVIFNKVTEDLIKWFAGNNLEAEIKKLHEEIAALRTELAEVRKIAVQAAERKTVKRVIEVEEDAETGEVVSSQPQQSHHQAPPVEQKPAEKPKTASVGAGPGRQELDPSQYDVSKVFYFGNKK